MLIVLMDTKNPVAVLKLPDGSKMEELREEYQGIMFPGKNPFLYNTEKQEDWIEKVREREQFLTLKYGGDKSGDGKTYYSPMTFANWLIREKGAVSVSFKQEFVTY